jgi:hypothetical protein
MRLQNNFCALKKKMRKALTQQSMAKQTSMFSFDVAHTYRCHCRHRHADMPSSSPYAVVA